MPWDEQGNLISYDEWRRRMVEKGKLKPLSPAPSVPSTPARPKPQSTVFREAIKAGVPKTPIQQMQGLQSGQVFLNVPPKPSVTKSPFGDMLRRLVVKPETTAPKSIPAVPEAPTAPAITPSVPYTSKAQQFGEKIRRFFVGQKQPEVPTLVRIDDAELDRRLAEKDLPTAAEWRQRNLDPQFALEHPTYMKFMYHTSGTFGKAVKAWEDSTLAGRFENRVGTRATNVVAGKPPQNMPTTGNKALDVVADIVGTFLAYSFPLGAPAQAAQLGRIGGYAVAPVLSRIKDLPSKLVGPLARLIGAGEAGFFQGILQSTTEKKPIAEHLKSAAEEATMWMLSEALIGNTLRWLGPKFNRAQLWLRGYREVGAPYGLRTGIWQKGYGTDSPLDDFLVEPITQQNARARIDYILQFGQKQPKLVNVIWSSAGYPNEDILKAATGQLQQLPEWLSLEGVPKELHPVIRNLQSAVWRITGGARPPAKTELTAEDLKYLNALFNLTGQIPDWAKPLLGVEQAKVIQAPSATVPSVQPPTQPVVGGVLGPVLQGTLVKPTTPSTEATKPETKPAETAKPETPPVEELPVKVGERMTAHRKRTGKEYTGIIERVYRGKQGQLLADIRLDDNTVKTIPASRQYTEWRTPKVEVPEVKAPEAPEVEAEVPTVPEVKPETPPVAEKPAAKEPWQMARDEYAALAAPHKLPPEYKALKAISDRDDGRPYNPHDITEEAVASLRTQGLISGVKKLKVKYPEGYHKLQDWLDLEKDNELVIGDALDRHYEIVRQALIEGKPVPPEVLKDYPDLASMVAPEAKAEHERELDMPKLEWGKQAPDYKSTLQSFAAWKRFLEEAKEVAYIDQPYGHKVPVYYYKGQLVRVGPSSSTSGHRYPVHIVDPNQYGEYFHWRNRQDVIEIAKKFGAEVRAKPRPVVLDIELGGSMQGTLKKPTSRVEIVQPESVTAKPEVPSVPEKPTELKPVAEAKVTPPAEVPAATAPQPKKEAPEVQKAPPRLPISPPVPQQQEEVRATIKGIISAFERLGAPVRVGRYAKKVRGIYKVQPEVIRTKLFGDVVAISHEVGHHLNKLWKLSSMTEHRDELVALAEAAGVEEENQSDLVKEGIAEFVRLTILDSATAQKQAPNMWNTWQGLLNDHPEVADVLDEVRQRINGLMSANPEERLLATMSIGEAPTRRRFLFRSWNDFLAKMVDDLAPLDPFCKAAEASLGRKLEPLEDPLMLAWRARGWQGKASIFLREGIRDAQGNLVAPSLRRALKAATAGVSKEERPIRINQFRAYAYARRLLEIAPRVKLLPGEGMFGREQVLADAQATVSKFDTPEFRRAFDILQQYQEQLIRQTLGNSGLYTQEMIDQIIASNQAYLPLHRVFEAMEAGRIKGAGRGYVDIQEAIKKLKGSSRLVVDPLESIVKNTYLFVSMAERNKVGVAVAELAEKAPGLGTWAERVSPKHYAQTVNLEEVLKQANEQLYEAVKGIADDLGLDFDQMVTLFRPAVVASPKENIAIIWRDGKPELWQLHPDLYEAMKWLDSETMTSLWQLLSYPAQILRAGAVLYNPVFWLRNPLRDQWTAFVFSKYGYIPGVDLVRGIFHILKHDEMYQLYHASGAAQSTLVSYDRNYLQADMRDILGEGRKSILETLREFSETMELATRLGEFERGLKKLGRTEEGLLRAAIAGRDITIDFGRRGTWGKQINKLAAFFNANVQGIDKLIRVFKEDPVGASFRAILAITLPSIALYLINRKNSRYWALSDYERDLYWHIPLPDGSFVRIAKPFEVGLLFGSFPERVLQWVDQQDPSAVDTLGATMSPYVSNLIHGILPNPIPTVAAPFVGWVWREVMAGRPVVPLSMQGLPPEEQYGPYTSTVGRLVGKALNISPMWFDEFVRSYMGGMGTATVDLIDDALRLADMPAPPAKDGLPILRTFIYGFRTRPASSTDPLTQQFYEIVNEIEGRYRTARIRIERGEAQGMTPEDIWWGTQASLCNRLADFLSELRKIQRVALTSPNLTDHEKQVLWEALDAMIMNSVRGWYGLPMLQLSPETREEATTALPKALNEYLRRQQTLKELTRAVQQLVK